MALAKRRSDVRVRFVDIQSWRSPVAQQHQIRRLPTWWLYEDGVRVATDRKEIAARLNALQ